MAESNQVRWTGVQNIDPVENILVEDSYYAESREVKASRFWFCASGAETAYNILTVTGEYLVDGKILAKQIDVTGTLKVRGEVELV